MSNARHHKYYTFQLLSTNEHEIIDIYTCHSFHLNSNRETSCLASVSFSMLINGNTVLLILTFAICADAHIPFLAQLVYGEMSVWYHE